MVPALATQRNEIAALCQRFRVERLDVFGSAARGDDFDPDRSDIDVLVSYLPGHTPTILDYADLKDALSALFRRPVDLVVADAVVNPYLRSSIEQSRQTLYAA